MKTNRHFLGIFLCASTTFFSSLLAQNSGDFRTISDGNWANPVIWETFNGTNWVNTPIAPQGGNVLLISVRHKTVITDSTTFSDNTVVSIDSSGRLDIYKTITNNGTIRNEGLIDWLSGDIITSDSLTTGNILNRQNGEVRIEIFTDARTSNQRIANGGSIIKYGSKTLTINELRDSISYFESDSTASMIHYDGLLDIKTLSTLGGSFVNYGLCRLSNPSGLRFWGSSFQNENRILGHFLRLESNDTQRLKGSGRYERLWVKNRKNVSILSNLTIENELNIQLGKINLLGNAITLGTSITNLALLKGGSDSAYFYNGTIRRWVNNPDTVSFPVGIASAFLEALVISEEKDGGGLLSLKYTITDPLTWGLPITDDNGFIITATCATCGVWVVETTNKFITRYRLELKLNNYPGINRPEDLRILYRPLPSEKWFIIGAHSNGNALASGYVARRTNITAFGEFAIGGGGENSLLPVELTQFTASRKGNSAFLQWETATELNASHYEIEWSNDARTFKAIGRIKAHGTTSVPQKYQFTDAQPEKGVQYYRLKIVDNDNTYGYSLIRSVLFDKTLKVWVYPNPFTEKLIVEADNTEGGKLYNMEVIDLTGKVCFSKKNIDNQQISLDLSHLPRGIYFAKWTKGNDISVLKIVKHK
jgi:Secretion system C-terminal sorting domain